MIDPESIGKLIDDTADHLLGPGAGAALRRMVEQYEFEVDDDGEEFLVRKDDKCSDDPS